MNHVFAFERARSRRADGARGHWPATWARPEQRPQRAMVVTFLLAAAVSLSGCGSSSASTATPAAQSTQTVIPMIKIVTPTPGKPGGGTAGATSTTAANPAPTPVQPANGKSGSYTVQAGDTLYGIAVRFNVSVQALMKANAITDPASLQTGQVLVIP